MVNLLWWVFCCVCFVFCHFSVYSVHSRHAKALHWGKNLLRSFCLNVLKYFGYFNEFSRQFSKNSFWKTFSNRTLRSLQIWMNFPSIITQEIPPLSVLHETGSTDGLTVLTSGERFVRVKKNKRNSTSASQNQLQFASRGISKHWNLSLTHGPIIHKKEKKRKKIKARKIKKIIFCVV